MDDNLLQRMDMGAKNSPDDGRDRIRPAVVSTPIPQQVDLRAWCSGIESQGGIKSCTAHAAVALVEYYEKRAFGQELEASRMFLYKVTRNLLNDQRDVGANPRITMKALTIFGVPPEEYWPYDEVKLYEEPAAFVYALAMRFRAEEYCRLDAKDVDRVSLCQQIKVHLAAQHPVMFNFVVPKSCFKVGHSGKVPLPSDSDPIAEGGHTVAAVGYNDNISVTCPETAVGETMGAFLIRNCWGPGWGDEGYGWVPYEYALQSLSNDWWVLLKQSWLDTGKFNAQK